MQNLFPVLPEVALSNPSLSIHKAGEIVVAYVKREWAYDPTLQ